jgi:phosphoglycolate phosphatase-like HAD superfamily hydrolase
LDADGTLWYAKNEESDGYQLPPQELVLDPHLNTLLSELKRYAIPLWVVSYNEPGRVETVVEYFGLSSRIPKNHISCNWRDKGERLREIISRNGIERALFVGDRGSDYRASIAAGILGRIIMRRFNVKHWVCGPTISSLLESLHILETI